MDFKNKVVVITGASSGIGKASAKKFAEMGAHIVLVARKKEKLLKLEKELAKFNTVTLVCQCNVADESQVKKMSEKVLEKFKKIDILVNNAGFAIYGTVLDLSIEDIDAQMATNYFGMVYCIKYFLPTMVKQKSGHIINIASVAASFGLPGIAPYCASKFAMLGFSEGLKYELEDVGIGVTVVSPIMVRTNFFEHPSFEKMPKYSITSISAQKVANAVLKAANSSRVEIIVPQIVRGAIWAKHTFPFLINPLIASTFKKQLYLTKK